ncbi:MAG: alpha/beta hydrolase [Gemmatimonadales bacterium]
MQILPPLPFTAPAAPRRRPRAAAAVPALAVLSLAALGACFRPSPPPYTPHDPALRAFPLLFYPSAIAPAPAKAFVFFVGNDIGFWGAHQDLAKRLAGAGYDVVGLDVKLFFRRLPGDTLARARLFGDSVAMMIALARRELGADSLPVVLGGHSLGAEVASWIALHAPPPHLAGLLLISSRGRGHLDATLSDIANRSAPAEPGSYSVAENIAALPASVRVAIVRGTDDRFRAIDPDLLKAGAGRIDKWSVPWGGHSMSNILLAGPFVERALAWTLQR